MSRIRTFYAIALVICCNTVACDSGERTGVTGEVSFGGAAFLEPEFLPVDEAFTVSAQRAGDGISLTFGIAPAHYLYKRRISASAGAAALDMELPAGVSKEDPYFGTSLVFTQSFDTRLVFGEGRAEFTIGYQGCAEAGLCYPPQKRAFVIEQGDQAVHIAEAPARRGTLDALN